MKERGAWLAAASAAVAGKTDGIVCPHCGLRSLEAERITSPVLPGRAEIRLHCRERGAENYVLPGPSHPANRRIDAHADRHDS